MEMVPGKGVLESDGKWRLHGGVFTFVTTVGGPASKTSEPLVLRLSMPMDAVDIASITGDQWQCDEVEDGLACRNANVVEAGGTWPALTVGVRQNGYAQDTFDVVVSGAGEGSAGVPVFLDSSV
ncbi:hypothetical protein [Umezawaea sp. Da 62-37]|uniref:hypothetical protein n=1 Tax=Umezawaea sp. Da 62-37 TaxID=3075927 RepID=UPI0028F6F4D7|nr:hypothetical protein [Umezawaea sp. Da 62-37]WNV90686.1 hypothetical protein RM788_21105 [Umezawaea sp. Da 62-37]